MALTGDQLAKHIRKLKDAIAKKELDVEKIEDNELEVLAKEGWYTARKLQSASQAQLQAVPGVNPGTAALLTKAFGSGAAAETATVGSGGVATAMAAAELHAEQAKAGARFVGCLADGLSCATMIDDGWLVSYAHGDHATWRPGDVKEVLFNMENVQTSNVDDLMRIQATIMYNSGWPKEDFILLQVQEGDLKKLPPPPLLTFQVTPAAQYVLVAASGRNQLGLPLSARHGKILSAYPDENHHIKGDAPSPGGDSSGGCFLVNGALFAINIAESQGGSALLPVAIPRAIMSQLIGGQQSSS